MNNNLVIKNLIFPVEFNHLNGGMLFSVVSLTKYLSKDFNIYIVAHYDAEIFKICDDVNKIPLKSKWEVSFSSPFKALRTYFEVRNALRNIDKANSVVITNNVGSELTMSGFGFLPMRFKRIFVSRGGDYYGKTGFFLKKSFNSVNHFVAISNRQLTVLQKSGISSSKIALIHNGVNTKNNFRYKFHKNEKIKISVVGYINSNKNQLLAVNALPKLLSSNYNIELNIYGLAYIDSDKEYERILRETISKHKIKDSVIFRGFEKETKNIYENTDILISCSLSEGFGRSIVEGMSFGIPCIGLKESGGLNDIIVNNVNGLLISNNSEQLVNSIIKICDDHSFRDYISKQAILTFKTKFTEEIMCEKYNSLLNEFLSNG